MEFTHPERSAGPDAGASVFGYFWRDKSDSPRGEMGSIKLLEKYLSLQSASREMAKTFP